MFGRNTEYILNGGVAQSVRVRGIAGVRVRVPPPPVKEGKEDE